MGSTSLFPVALLRGFHYRKYDKYSAEYPAACGGDLLLRDGVATGLKNELWHIRGPFGEPPPGPY